MNLPCHKQVDENVVVLVQNIQIQAALDSCRPQFHHLKSSTVAYLSNSACSASENQHSSGCAASMHHQHSLYLAYLFHNRCYQHCLSPLKTQHYCPHQAS